jgi:hypothetical protein
VWWFVSLTAFIFRSYSSSTSRSLSRRLALCFISFSRPCLRACTSLAFNLPAEKGRERGGLNACRRGISRRLEGGFSMVNGKKRNGTSASLLGGDKLMDPRRQQLLTRPCRLFWLLRLLLVSCNLGGQCRLESASYISLVKERARPPPVIYDLIIVIEGFVYI